MHRVAVGLIVLALGCGTDDPSITGSDGDTASTESASSGGGTTDGLSASGGQDGSTASPGDDDDDDDDDDDNGTTQGVDDDGTTAGPGESTTGSAGEDSTSDGGPNTTGNPGCGNGMVEPGEQCDGDDLQGFDCSGLGLGEGPLGCDPVMCTFDTSMCMAGSGTGFANL